MTEYPYLGRAPATYPQYLAVTKDGDRTLSVVPGGTYEMRPAAGYEDEGGGSLLPVPPDDCLWGDAVTGKAAAASKKKGA